MPRTHEKVEEQFGLRAKAYVEGAVHARGPDLDAFEAVVRQAAPDRALAFGTGGGHVANLISAYARAIKASDLSGYITVTPISRLSSCSALPRTFAITPHRNGLLH
ncbi:MAG: hypothetical protein ACREUR_06730 [Nitrosospira sp.]